MTVDGDTIEVEGGALGVGNINMDPMFVDSANGNFHLQSSSPCIDAGDRFSSPDRDGSVADQGAIPFFVAR